MKLSAEALEILYRKFRNRMIDDLRIDPIFLQLMAAAPEIDIVIQPQIIQLEGSTLKGRLARLIANGFMDEMRLTGTVKKELMRTGTEPNGGNLSTALGDFVKDGFMVRDGDGYRKAPGIKVTERRLET